MTAYRPRIALVNAWHDDNRGDSAIAEATIDLLRDRWVDLDLTVVSLLDDRHPEFGRANRHLRTRSRDLHVVGNAMPHLDRNGGVFGMALQSLRFACRLPGAVLALVAPRTTRRPAFLAIGKADLVVVSGGHSIASQRHSLVAWINLWRVLLPVLYASRTRRPSILLGHSLGPFPDRPSRWFASFVLRRADQVVVREARSHTEATELGIAADRLSLAPDIAFALQPRDTPRVSELVDRHGLHGMRVWIVTVRQVYETTDRATRTERFLDEMARFVEGALAGDHADLVVLVPHTVGPVTNEDDRPITARLAVKLDEQRVIVIDDDLEAGEIAALYGQATLLVGTRLHSVILALVAGTPAVAIAYFGPKAQGTMELIGCAPLCVGIDDVTGDGLLDLIGREDPIARAATIASRVSELSAEVTGAIAGIELTLTGSR